MISFDSVTKIYPNDHAAIKDVSFTIDPGEFAFILGRSGSGKTTLLRLIIREIKPSSGKIIVAEHDLSLLPDSEIPHLRRQIGSAFQDFKLIRDKTAFENVALAVDILGKPSDEITDTAISLLKKVGLGDKTHLFPSQLSGGEIQRVAIARALAQEPVLIFADEPTGNLDPKTSQQIVELLKQINEAGTTVIMATHDQNLAKKFSKRNIFLENGQVTLDTKPKSSKQKVKPPTDTKPKTDKQPQPKADRPLADKTSSTPKTKEASKAPTAKDQKPSKE